MVEIIRKTRSDLVVLPYKRNGATLCVACHHSIHSGPRRDIYEVPIGIEMNN